MEIFSQYNLFYTFIIVTLCVSVCVCERAHACVCARKCVCVPMRVCVCVCEKVQKDTLDKKGQSAMGREETTGGIKKHFIFILHIIRMDSHITYRNYERINKK